MANLKRHCRAVALLGGLLLGGCSTLGGWLGFGPDYAALDSLKVLANNDANQDAAGTPCATELDIVFAYSDAAISQLPKTAPQWFAQKTALQNGLAQDLAVLSLQLPPSTAVKAVPLADKADKALQIIAYARYFAVAGQNRMDLTQAHSAQLTLRAKDLQLINLDD